MTRLSKELHPGFFSGEVALNSIVDADGFIDAYTIAEPERYTLIDNAVSENARYMIADIRTCNLATSNITCASEQELVEFYSRHKLVILKTDNFIDYDDNVEPFKGPLKKTSQVLTISDIRYDKVNFFIKRFSL